MRKYSVYPTSTSALITGEGGDQHVVGLKLKLEKDGPDTLAHNPFIQLASESNAVKYITYTCVERIRDHRKRRIQRMHGTPSTNSHITWLINRCPSPKFGLRGGARDPSGAVQLPPSATVLPDVLCLTHQLGSPPTRPGRSMRKYPEPVPSSTSRRQ